MTRPTLVYVAGPGHSGSSLLDQVLSLHPEVSALGEVHRLSLTAQSSHQAFACSCGQRVEDCEFWQRVLSELSGNEPGQDISAFLLGFPTTVAEVPAADPSSSYMGLGRSQRRTPLNLDRVSLVVGSRRIRQVLGKRSSSVCRGDLAARNSVKLFEAVRLTHHTPVIVDSSKNAGRLKTLWLERDRAVDFKLLRIVRDGRAVAASRMRREDVSMSKAAAIWRAENRRFSAVRRTMVGVDEFVLSYESFCTSPDVELAKVYQWLGLESLSHEGFGSAQRHNLSGNPVRFETTRMQQIQLDERWRDELKAADLEAFEAVSGTLNRKLGYAD